MVSGTISPPHFPLTEEKWFLTPFLTITFTPGRIGPRTTTLSIIDSAFNSPQTVTLTGTGF